MRIVALCAAAIITATVVAQFAQVGNATVDVQLPRSLTNEQRDLYERLGKLER